MDQKKSCYLKITIMVYFITMVLLFLINISMGVSSQQPTNNITHQIMGSPLQQLTQILKPPSDSMSTASMIAS